MEIGLENCGFKTSVCVEIDGDCRETLRQNRPSWKLFEDHNNRKPGDIRNIKPSEILKLAGLKPGDVALVTGGAPCQPFSNIGKKQGKDDPRNGDLFLEFVKIVKGVKPRAFIFENVAGITQAKHAEVVEYMKHQFDGLGYGISFDILNAADYGVPQQRKRFIMIGLLGDKPAFPLPTHFKGTQEWKKFSLSLKGMPTYVPAPWNTVASTLKSMDRKLFKRRDCLGMQHSEEMKKRMGLIKQGQNFKVLPMNMRPKCWQTGKHQGHDTFGRMEADKPAPTIRTAGYNPTKGKYIHPFEDRGLNTAEMSALQSFPAEWEFCTLSGRPSIVSIGRQIGNAVPPLLAEALGKALALQIKKSSK
ncbi:MAG: DNA cytosine methyltransferase [Alphaproteobacteria bacterium]|nr:DNA cytosine methyltransferase [Alphaproteobacteria bacterium]